MVLLMDEIRQTHQLRLVVFPIIYKGLGPSQVVGDGIRNINSSSEYGINWHRILEKRSSKRDTLKPFTPLFNFNITHTWKRVEIIQHQFTSHLTIYSHSFIAKESKIWQMFNPQENPSSKKKKLQIHFSSHIFVTALALCSISVPFRSSFVADSSDQRSNMFARHLLKWLKPWQNVGHLKELKIVPLKLCLRS